MELYKMEVIIDYYDISVPDNIDVNKYVSVLMESGEFETVDFNYISCIKRVEEKQYLKQSNSLCFEEQPIRNGMIDFSRVRSGLYVLMLTPAGREPETFKLSLK